MRKRTKARESALQVLYQVDITGGEFEAALEDFCATKERLEESVKDFVRVLVSGAIGNLKKIDSIISHFATNWQIKRMATVDRNLLRLATYELVFMEDIPDKVSLNEAVELAKKYGDEESSKFVNGVLDKVAKEEKKEYAAQD